MGEKRRLLIVEDDEVQLELLASLLEIDDYEVIKAGSAEAARSEIQKFDMALIDLGLPDESGLTLAEELKSRHRGLSIVFVTQSNERDDRVRGIDLGGDDYITKPYHPDELLGRIRNIFNRIHGAQSTRPPERSARQIRGFTIDFDRGVISYGDGESTRLTNAEHKLLSELSRADGRTLTREHLLQEINGANYDVYDRTIDVLVSNTRKKLGKVGPNGHSLIVTVTGRGYRLDL